MKELRAQDARRPLDSYALLIVDQFEELFSLCDCEHERAEYVAELSGRAAAGLPMVISVRADFYGHCLTHPHLFEALRERAFGCC